MFFFDSNLEDMIPCEICDQLIEISEYMFHINNHNLSTINDIIGANDYINRSNTTNDYNNMNNDNDNDNDNPIVNILNVLNSIANIPMNNSYNTSNNININENAGNEILNYFNEILLPSFLDVDNDNNDEDDKNDRGLGEEEREEVYDIDSITNIYLTSCPICLEDLSGRVVVKTKCNHKYCKTCIDDWLSKHTTCPICMKDYYYIKDNPIF